MFELIQKGGPVMIPIVVLCLAASGIMIERAVYFFFTGTDYKIFKDQLLDRIHHKDLDGVSGYKPYFINGKNQNLLKRIKQKIALEQWNRSPYLKISTTYIENIDKGNRSRDEALRRVGSEEIERMEKNFKGLSSISHVSPLLGLLGTVTGIIGAFAVISELGGQVDVTALASGIWEAMITTAAGLVVAIPAQLAYLYFEKIVSERANRMSYIITYLNEELFSSKKGEIGNDEPGCSTDIIHHEMPEEVI